MGIICEKCDCPSIHRDWQIRHDRGQSWVTCQACDHTQSVRVMDRNVITDKNSLQALMIVRDSILSNCK